MTVYISADAKNLREELASLRNQGGYQEQQFYFDSLVTNGTFDTATTGWTGNNSTLSVVSSKLRVTWSTATSPRATQQILSGFTKGKTYAYRVEVGAINGGTAAELWIGSGPTNPNYANPTGISPSSTATGTFTVTGDLLYMSLVFNGTTTGHYADFDNVSIFETDGTDVVHRMPKGWKPKDVFEDGLLQREGAAHDYEVVYDGFDYYVKPAVAPSATTQTCVIGVKA
jgi:hypothetical protein